MTNEWSPEVKSKLKSIMSITRPRAVHDYDCAWCNAIIKRNHHYVRAVWQEANRVKHSDHICVECWDIKP